MATATDVNVDMDLDVDVIETLEDLLERLGGIEPRRVRLRPAPGTATEADLVRVNDRKRGICELVDGVLVEKPMGMLESYLAGVIIRILGNFIVPRNLGILTSPDGVTRILPGIFRAPDVSFFSWDRIPGGALSAKALAGVVPDLAVEVLSPSNTRAEMARKRREYFAAGVRLVWEVDLPSRTVAVYRGPEGPTILGESETLEGGSVLPGFALPLAELFAELDRRPG